FSSPLFLFFFFYFFFTDTATTEIYTLSLHDALPIYPALPFDKAAVAREMHLIDAEGRVYRGAAAILEILGRYPRWAFVAGIGRSPLVRPLLPLGYAIVAANRRFLFGPASRIFWLKATALIAFCIGLAISSPLWIGPRSYPPVPVWGGLPPLGHPLDYVLYGSLF